MTDLNIHDDSRDRGLEVLLYKKEKDQQLSQKEPEKFKFKFVIPFLFNREFNFHFEAYTIKKQ